MATCDSEQHDAPGLAALANHHPPSSPERWRDSRGVAGAALGSQRWELKVLHHLDATTVTILGLSECLACPRCGLHGCPSGMPADPAPQAPGSWPRCQLQTSVPASPIGVVSEASVTGKPESLPPRPTLLAGRADLLSDLDTRLATGHHAWPRIVVLCGLGGTGKTSVAVEYAHRHLAEVGVAWQFAADDPAVLAAALGELAAQLGARRCPRPAGSGWHRCMRRWPPSGRGELLVFDNAPD